MSRVDHEAETPAGLAGKPFTYCHAFSRCCRNAVSAQEPSASATKHYRNVATAPRHPSHAPERPKAAKHKGPIYSLAGLLLFFFSGCLLEASSRESIESARPAPFGDSDIMAVGSRGGSLSSLVVSKVGGSKWAIRAAAD